jgi:hypothetical protein
MVTIIDVIRYEIHKKSDKIAEIKKQRSGQLLENGNYAHIGPSSARWNEYVWLKRDASILLTALRLLKYGTAGDCHARKGKPAKTMSRHARKLLRKFGNRLEKKPHLFADAEQWAIQRAVEAEARAKAPRPPEDGALQDRVHVPMQDVGEHEPLMQRMRTWLGV